MDCCLLAELRVRMEGGCSAGDALRSLCASESEARDLLAAHHDELAELEQRAHATHRIKLRSALTDEATHNARTAHKLLALAEPEIEYSPEQRALASVGRVQLDDSNPGAVLEGLLRAIASQCAPELLPHLASKLAYLNQQILAARNHAPPAEGERGYPELILEALSGDANEEEVTRLIMSWHHSD
jgi:hypothetical protein